MLASKLNSKNYPTLTFPIYGIVSPSDYLICYDQIATVVYSGASSN